MSNLYMIISEKRIDFLPKERYLKFTEYTNKENLFVYTRYDYSLDMVNLICNNQYKISNNGKVLIRKILSDQNYVYWSNIQLVNHMGEEEAYFGCLKTIKDKNFINKSNLDDVFNINSLYCLIS
ncbi:hypothetical protein MOMA_04485 [Moraxella macacae 0408225]|uniref:Uncharacterized protein n=1 Tax=Moraxella macacae 0408225 TaxID=1230338 RepID=L2FB20_9GAMM|nr:hypothetical protein [Moraxella macacae]ELA09633.1 hypothetical protein MOMA_04485 [Moraxella macacae 0408225]